MPTPSPVPKKCGSERNIPSRAIPTERRNFPHSKTAFKGRGLIKWRNKNNCFLTATETMSEAVYTRALEIVQSKCEPSAEQTFSLKVKNFHEDQIQAARNVPNHRFLIETDSPYCTIPSNIRINNPRRIGQVAMILAGIRSQPVAEIFAITRENGKSLYGQIVNCVIY
ncbi:tatD [Mytilus coruscus]|uniref:TatD n=1 Tax=Mytilus coruscus TaxID=42192 RepID=A0A6J8ASK6_MYTCO|nr:tatD [Mytilus coruscus]